MIKIFKSRKAIGLELSSTEIRGAEVSFQRGEPFIHQLFAISLPIEELSHVKPLYIPSSPLCTGIDGYDVLLRACYLPLTKEKDVEAALAFQAEPLLPYPFEQALIGRQILQRTHEGTNLTIFAVRKDLIEKHLLKWQPFKIEPEYIFPIQVALCQFGSHSIHTEKPFLIFHFTENFITGVLVKNGKLLASYTHAEGLNLFNPSGDGESASHFKSVSLESISVEAIKRVQQTLMKIHYALSKETKGEILEGVLLTGAVMQLEALPPILVQHLNLPLLQCRETADKVASEKKQLDGVSIGLALASFAPHKESINFRREEFSFPYPWKRIKVPLICYYILMALLTWTFYHFGQQYRLYQEDKLRQDYVDLLASMNKSFDNFEESYLAKYPSALERTDGEKIDIIHLNREELLERLAFLQKDLQSTPESFPLFANIPHVSDVLAWLSQHPYVVQKDENGLIQQRLQLENFSYTMLKRPIQGKKQEKYQVKVELEFSSPTPKWAREFHDALIASNDVVDPKGEVKWSSNRGKYRTSFFLKDKTFYPNQ